jgi:hypothetical protein
MGEEGPSLLGNLCRSWEACGAAAPLRPGLRAAGRSYHLLDDNLDRARMGDPHAAENVPAALQYTLATTHSFGTAIERCLGLPPSNIATL